MYPMMEDLYRKYEKIASGIFFYSKFNIILHIIYTEIFDHCTLKKKK